MPDNMLVVGRYLNASNTAITIDLDRLKHHALVFGQSGSGKSFLIARLIEEILRLTAARVLIIDPNGDFRKIDRPNQETWKDEVFKSTFSDFFNLFKSEYDQETNFRERMVGASLQILDSGADFVNRCDKCFRTKALRSLGFSRRGPAKVPARS